jgi:hypothetical protein
VVTPRECPLSQGARRPLGAGTARTTFTEPGVAVIDSSEDTLIQLAFALKQARRGDRMGELMVLLRSGRLQYHDVLGEVVGYVPRDLRNGKVRAPSNSELSRSLTNSPTIVCWFGPRHQGNGIGTSPTRCPIRAGRHRRARDWAVALESAQSNLLCPPTAAAWPHERCGRARMLTIPNGIMTPQSDICRIAASRHAFSPKLRRMAWHSWASPWRTRTLSTNSTCDQIGLAKAESLRLRTVPLVINIAVGQRIQRRRRTCAGIEAVTPRTADPCALPGSSAAAP